MRPLIAIVVVLVVAADARRCGHCRSKECQRGARGPPGEDGAPGAPGPCPTLSLNATATPTCPGGNISLTCSNKTTSTCLPLPPPLDYFVHNTNFVDVEFGDDLTAVVESPVHPFQTIQAAIDAAAALARSNNTWQVQLRPGVYTSNTSIVLAAYVNLLGITTQGSFIPSIFPGPETYALIEGSLTDGGTGGVPVQLTDIIILSDNEPAATFDQTFRATLTNCILASIYTNCTDVALCPTLVVRNAFTHVVLQHTQVYGLYAFVGLPTTAVAVVYVDNAFLDLEEASAVTALGSSNTVLDLTFIKVRWDPVTLLTAVTSDNTQFTVTWYALNTSLDATFAVTIYQVDNANVTSQDDTVDFGFLFFPVFFGGYGVLPDHLPTFLARLGADGGLVQRITVANMVVTYNTKAPSTPPIVTLDNQNKNYSDGFFYNTRFNGLSAPALPTQSPTNFNNVYRQVNTLIDNQGGGQDLATTVTITTLGYTVKEIDAILLYKGIQAGIINLPKAANYLGRRLTIRCLSQSVNLLPFSGDTIDSQPNWPLFATGPNIYGVILVSDGTINWWIVASWP